MSQDDTMFREVDDDLEQEKQMAQLRKYGPFYVVIAVLVVVGVAVSQYMAAEKVKRNASYAEQMNAAIETFNETQGEDLAPMQAMASSKSPGYRAMAHFKLASEYATNDRKDEALAELNAVIDMGGIPERLQNLARLQAANIMLDTNPEGVVAMLNGMEAKDSLFGVHALELAALQAMQQKNYGHALSMFQQIQSSTHATDGLQQRAEEFAALAHLGQEGIVLDYVDQGTELESLFQDVEIKEGDETGASYGEDADLETPTKTPTDALVEGDVEPEDRSVATPDEQDLPTGE